MSSQGHAPVRHSARRCSRNAGGVIFVHRVGGGEDGGGGRVAVGGSGTAEDWGRESTKGGRVK